MTNIQENIKNLFDAENIQENMKKICDVEAAKEAFTKLADNDAVKAIKEAVEKSVDQEAIKAAVEKNSQLASNLVAANTNVVSDAIILQSTQARNGVEGFLKQVDVLVNTKDVKAAFEAQKAFAEQTTEALRELALMSVDIITGAVESNVSLIKDATVKPAAKKAPAKKAVAKKAPVKEASPKAA